jgi:hypothetical protein
MPCNYSIKKIIALVDALAKFHNFCINERDGTPDSIPAVDHEHLMSNEGGYIGMVSNETHDVLVPEGIMDCGHHFQEIPRAYRRAWINDNPEEQLA